MRKKSEARNTKLKTKNEKPAPTIFPHFRINPDFRKGKDTSLDTEVVTLIDVRVLL